MIMYHVKPMIPLYNGFYLFPLSRAVNLNRLIFDPSEVEFTNTCILLALFARIKTNAMVLDVANLAGLSELNLAN